MITRPLSFEEAIRFLLDKEQLPAEWDAAEWQSQDPEFRRKAFFSANVENARFLDRAQGLLFDFLAKVRDDVTLPNGMKSTVLRVGSRADFVMLMRDFMIEEGMADVEEFQDVNQKDIGDIRSMARLNLIFDTTVRQAYGYGHWKQGMAPAVRAAFPAARLIRDKGVMEPRPRHQEHLGDVRLKSDIAWWADYQNDRDIGGFGVPWGPYGFNSGVNQEDVSREEAAELGIYAEPSSPVETPGFNERTSASTKGMSPELKAKLKAELQAKRPERMDPSEIARREAAKTRRIMLDRGLENARSKGDTALIEKYQKAIVDLPSDDGIRIREEGDRILME